MRIGGLDAKTLSTIHFISTDDQSYLLFSLPSYLDINKISDERNFKLKNKSEVKSPSRVRLFAIPWTIAYQAPPSMGFSRQEYWRGLPFPSPGIFLTQGSNLGLPHCRQMLYPLNHQRSPRKTKGWINR